MSTKARLSPRRRLGLTPLAAARAAARATTRDRRGAAAVEMALIAPLLIFLALNVIDLAYYQAQRMEVHNAAKAAAEAIRFNCSGTTTPVAGNCTNSSSYASTGAQSTTLGSLVTVSTGYPVEAYECVNSSGTLDTAGVSQPPAVIPTTCPSTAQTDAPGDWVTVQVQYQFNSLFGGGTIAGSFNGTLYGTASVRVD